MAPVQSREPVRSSSMAAAALLLLLLLSGARVLQAAAAAGATVEYSSAAATQNLFSLDSYGARGDGTHDDTPALAKAWDAACSSPLPAVLLVPGGKSYLLKLTTLSGTCKSTVVFMVKGTLVASPNRSDWTDNNRRHWIVFRGVTGLTVTGGGTIDGSGEVWWKNSCKTNKAQPCKGAPTALTFHTCKDLTVQNLNIINSQQIHVSIENCSGAQLSRLSITAPDTSPNTDGIHVTRSSDVQVSDCTIKTGDDCISIEDGTHDLHVTRVVCGPGHGISIGSLGDGGSRAEVSAINIDTVQLHGTTNGARIKTYQGGSGYAKGIVFQNMIMDNVNNPIIIDQNYCDSSEPCKEEPSAVEVSDVVFRNIRGTTVSKDAIQLICSKNVPCHDIALQNIDLKMEGGKSDTESTCQNVKLEKSGIVVPEPCSAKKQAAVLELIYVWF